MQLKYLKLILTGPYLTIKSNSFRLGYFPIYLSYGLCKSELFWSVCCLLRRLQQWYAKATTHIRIHTVLKPTQPAYKENKAG